MLINIKEIVTRLCKPYLPKEQHISYCCNKFYVSHICANPDGSSTPTICGTCKNATAALKINSEETLELAINALDKQVNI